MKKKLKWIVAFIVLVPVMLFAGCVAWPLDLPDPRTSDQPLYIRNATIVDIEQATVVPQQSVLIEGEKITAAGPGDTIPVPPGAQIIEADGRYLIPALWDMHTHVYAVSPMLDLPLYIAYGVTNVRDMQGCPKAGDPFIACVEDKRRWSEEAVEGKRVAPRVVATTSFMANGPGMLKRLKGAPEFFATATPQQAREFVRHFAATGVDAIKVYDRIPREAYFALVDEANQLGLDVVGHRPHGVTAIEAARHQKSIEHARFILHESFPGSADLRELAGTPDWQEDRRRMLDEHDPAMAQQIFAAMKRHGTWYVPTHLTRWADAYADDPAVREDPLLRFLHPLMKWQWLEDVDATLARDPSPEARETYREFYQRGLELTGRAHKAGVRILVGTDYIVAGADVHRELENLVAAGLSPADALRAATLSPAEYFELQDTYGTIAVGKVADIVLLNANPLDDIRNTRRIDAVIFNGNHYDRAALDEIEQHVESQAGSWNVAAKILWRFVRNPVNY